VAPQCVNDPDYVGGLFPPNYDPTEKFQQCDNWYNVPHVNRFGQFSTDSCPYTDARNMLDAHDSLTLRPFPRPTFTLYYSTCCPSRPGTVSAADLTLLLLSPPSPRPPFGVISP
jgi:hypothetical protein